MEEGKWEDVSGKMGEWENGRMSQAERPESKDGYSNGSGIWYWALAAVEFGSGIAEEGEGSRYITHQSTTDGNMSCQVGENQTTQHAMQIFRHTAVGVG